MNIYLADVKDWANWLGLQYKFAHITTVVEPSKSVGQTHSLPDSSNAIGRDEDKNKIISWLNDSGNDHEKLSVISVVGLGALGKLL